VEMSCSAHARVRNTYKVLNRKCETRQTIMCRWKVTIKRDFKELNCESVEWVCFPQD
jgi:hypothetical protein